MPNDEEPEAFSEEWYSRARTDVAKELRESGLLDELKVIASAQQGIVALEHGETLPPDYDHALYERTRAWAQSNGAGELAEAINDVTRALASSGAEKGDGKGNPT